MTKNPNWTRDELILALDLYFSEGRKQLEPSHPKVVELSQMLNQLPIHPKEFQDNQFRNQNGVSMKLGNFLAIDPDYDGVGLSRGSKLENEVWEEFAYQPYQLKLVANAIRDSIPNLKEPEVIYETSDDEFTEGRILTRLHKQRERNTKLVKRKKESVLKKTGTLLCEVCEFNFEDFYGKLGQGYAECHHLIPLSELNETRKTKLSDIAIVCSNCHRMLHRPKKMLTILELKRIIKENLEEE